MAEHTVFCHQPVFLTKYFPLTVTEKLRVDTGCNRVDGGGGATLAQHLGDTFRYPQRYAASVLSGVAGTALASLFTVS